MDEQISENHLIDTGFGLMNLNYFSDDVEDSWMITMTHCEHTPVYLAASMSKDMWLKVAHDIQEYFGNEG